jgi:hypothetical protein
MIRLWTRAVAAIRLSLIGMTRPEPRSSPSSCAHLSPVSLFHDRQCRRCASTSTTAQVRSVFYLCATGES